MKLLSVSLTLCLATHVFAQTPASNSAPALQVLSQQGPNLSSWVLAPIDRSIPDAIRQNVTFLREDLIDEGKSQPKASLEAYRVAHQLCSSLIAALDEREKMLLKAGYRAVQANVVTPATNQALEARRNYLMSWPQYEREVQQRNDLLRVVEAADRRKVELALQDMKLEWAKRVEPLRNNLDVLYVKLRAALRDSGVTAKTFDGAQGGSKGNAPAVPVLPPPTVTQPARAIPQGTFTNSLGMKFVPVPGTSVLMCIHETRNIDYAAYAAGQGGVDASWRKEAQLGKEQHPVTRVNYHDARDFCAWLSKREGKTYRIPTDSEWSLAVGLGVEKGGSPEEKDRNGPLDVYPWGDNSPPTPQDGNYGLKDVNDGYAGTSPVMSFRANGLGIYDLGGNVDEWCQDVWGQEDRIRVLRGSSFIATRVGSARSAGRAHDPEVSRFDNWHGFRCVLDSSPSQASPESPQADVLLNTVCPISGKAANPAFTSTYKKTVAVCCKKCKAEFNAFPNLYLGNILKAASDQCPLSKKKSDPSITVTYTRHVAFADAASKATFDAAPDKYIKEVRK